MALARWESCWDVAAAPAAAAVAAVAVAAAAASAAAAVTVAARALRATPGRYDKMCLLDRREVVWAHAPGIGTLRVLVP